MPGRSIWKGSLTFGLVNIPVSVHSITKSERPRLNQVCQRDAAPVRYKRWCPKEDRELPYEEIGFGMRVGADVIVVSKEELDSLAQATENEIRIERFVPLDGVPPVYFDKPYELRPQEKLSPKSFALFVDAVTRAGKAAVGRVALRNREHPVVIYPDSGRLIMDTLRFPQEIEPGEPPKITAVITKEERALAGQLVERLAGEFDPKEFRDEYGERLAQLLETKGTRKLPEVPPSAGATKAQELVEVLRKSVQARKRKLDAHDRKHGVPHARLPVQAV
jgi:DNA end-binding protein Ku